jgi:competence ComEA-like helix-hairpin-helix protein
MRKQQNNSRKATSKKSHQHSIWYDLNRNLTDYFTFSRYERNSMMVLSIVCLLFFLIPQGWKLMQDQQKTDFSAVLKEVNAFVLPIEIATTPTNVEKSLFQFDPNVATFEDFTKLGLSEKLSNTILNYRDKGGKFYDEGDFQKMYGLSTVDFERLAPYIALEKKNYPNYKDWEHKNWDKKDWDKKEDKQIAESFEFDPNTVSEPELMRLGLSEKQAAMWIKFRNAGAKFKTVTDLKKLYGLTEKNYAHLEPLVKINPTTLNEVLAANAYPKPQTYSGGATSFNSNKLSVGQTIDINKSSVEDWQKIPQIGAFRAKNIVDFREKLGGFSSIAQLSEMRGFPDSTYQAIKPFLKFEASVFRKININTATFEELDKHPLIDKKQASLIIAYREQHGKFANAKEIGAILAFTDKVWLEKVCAYLSVD